MNEVWNVYCDESCHLENDGHKAMVIGAVYCPQLRSREIALRVRDIKEEFGLPAHFEIKWTKVSQGKLAFYKRLIDYFFDDDDLRFRAFVVEDKAVLNHEAYGQSHDDFYYKSYFQMLKVIFNEKNHYRIYIDIKDTLGHEKASKLHDVLCNSVYDFDCRIVERLQQIRSEESSVLQLADLLIGALSYHARGSDGSAAKLELIELIKKRSGKGLVSNTLVRENKFNLFFWEGGAV